MKKQITTILIVLFTFSAFGQISYEKGYYINSSNVKVFCLIKNIDWKNNPDSFLYKIAEDNEPKIASIKTVREFGVLNGSKYIRKTLQFFSYNENLSRLTNVRSPKFKEKQLFLKILVEGKANLYLYEDTDSRKFFFDIDTSETQQLVFKKYLKNDNKIGENNFYRQQLLKKLKCESFKINKFKNLEYSLEDLSAIFNDYNACSGEVFTNYTKTQKKNLFHVSLRPRIDFSTLEIITGSTYIDFGSKTNIGIGVELEQFLPFNKNKWSIILEPSFQQYASSRDDIGGNLGKADVEYKTLEFPLGVRHHFYFSEYSKLFLNVSVALNVAIGNSRLRRGFIEDEAEIESETSAAFGVGYKYKKYSIELRYFPDRTLFIRGGANASEYNTVSFILGYSFF